jgi:hypothetical protein
VNLSTVVLYFCLAQISGSTNVSEQMQRLRAQVSIDLVIGRRASEIAGHYSSNPKELGTSPLNGNDLYLFPDGTYLYAEWGDLEPLTIRDKGNWNFIDGVLALTSDPG